MLFHKVPRLADPLVPNELCLSQFENILDFLTENSRVIPLTDAIDALERNALPARATVLTFDDGYADWMETVAPSLRSRNLPATFFLTTEQFSGPTLWHERIVSAVRGLPEHGADLPYGFAKFSDLNHPSHRTRLISELQNRLKYAPLHERIAAIELLETQANVPLTTSQHFDEKSARALHAQGFEIGAHTKRHPILTECTELEAREEIGGCKEQLEAAIRGSVTSFAYPNGRPLRDFNSTHIRMVKEAGYRCAVVTSGGAANRHSDKFQLPRFTPWGKTDLRMGYQLARNILSKERAISTAQEHATPVRALMIASTFPPIHGGSAVVYDSLCKHMPCGSIRVLTARYNYLTHKEIEGWEKHDLLKTYPIERADYLRPPSLPPPANTLVSIYRLLFQDIPLYLRVLWQASRIVRKHRINLVCIGELVSGSWLGIALRRLFGCRLLIYVHGEEITTASAGSLLERHRKNYLAAADMVVAVSAFTCEALTRDMELSPCSVTLIENGVDTDLFTPGERDNTLLLQHGLADRRIVLTVGRLVSRKGMDMGIRAIGLIAREIKDVHYVIVGDGEYKSELESIIKQEGLQSFVTLVGKVDEPQLVSWLRSCDVFMMPNRTMPDGDTEGFGLVFREANACGKPVIGGRAGGAVEAVVDGETGLLVDGNKPEEIAAALTHLLQTPRLADKYGRQGLQLAQSKNTKSVASRFLKVCERVVRLHENER